MDQKYFRKWSLCKMTHFYRFRLFSSALDEYQELTNQPVTGTEVIVSYSSEQVQSNDNLEFIARLLISQSMADWLTGDAEMMNEYVSLNVLKDHLLSQRLYGLATWVNEFNDIAMHNLDNTPGTCIWITFT